MNRIPTILLVSSWDNLTSKSLMPFRPDKLVVWNETMKKEAVELHGYKAEDVFVAGAPQFDIYADRSGFLPREKFFTQFGGAPAKKLILYATGSHDAIPHEVEIVEILAELVNSGALVRPCQLLVRLHPQDSIENYSSLRNLPNVFFDVPGKTSSFLDREFTVNDLRHLGESMLYSDLVITVSSTIVIDAAIFDTPSICVAFDGKRDREFDNSVRRFHEYSHFKNLVKTNGVKIANNIDELVQQINAYLADPSLNREERSKIVEEQCFKIDGQSGRRVGSFILNVLDQWHKVL